jgi:arylsulfatase A-like enzyme
LSDRDLFFEFLKYGMYGHDTWTCLKFKKLRRYVNKNNGPVFGFINSKSPHNPYDPPRPYKGKYSNELSYPPFEFLEKIKEAAGLSHESVNGFDERRLKSMSHNYPLIGNEFEPTQKEWEVIKSWYDGSIRYTDKIIGDFIEYLKRQSLYENSIVIIASDHGEQFGENSLEKHWLSLYDELLKVPLVISGGAIDQSARVGAIVSLADIFPTVSYLAGADDVSPEFAEPLLPIHSVYHQYVVSEVGKKDTTAIERRHENFKAEEYEDVLGPLRSVRTEDAELIHSANGSKMFNWKAGRELDLESNTHKAEQLQEVIDDELPGFPEWSGKVSTDDEEVRSRLKKLGYL